MNTYEVHQVVTVIYEHLDQGKQSLNIGQNSLQKAKETRDSVTASRYEDAIPLFRRASDACERALSELEKARQLASRITDKPKVLTIALQEIERLRTDADMAREEAARALVDVEERLKDLQERLRELRQEADPRQAKLSAERVLEVNPSNLEANRVLQSTPARTNWLGVALKIVLFLVLAAALVAALYLGSHRFDSWLHPVASLPTIPTRTPTPILPSPTLVPTHVPTASPARPTPTPIPTPGILGELDEAALLLDRPNGEPLSIHLFEGVAVYVFERRTDNAGNEWCYICVQRPNCRTPGWVLARYIRF